MDAQESQYTLQVQFLHVDERCYASCRRRRGGCRKTRHVWVRLSGQRKHKLLRKPEEKRKDSDAFGRMIEIEESE